MLRAAAAAGISEAGLWDMLPREFERRMRAWREERQREAKCREDRSEELLYLACLIANNALAEEPLDAEKMIERARRLSGDSGPIMSAEGWAEMDLSGAH